MNSLKFLSDFCKLGVKSLNDAGVKFISSGPSIGSFFYLISFNGPFYSESLDKPPAIGNLPKIPSSLVCLELFKLPDSKSLP
jgi:hypothetical protein